VSPFRLTWVWMITLPVSVQRVSTGSVSSDEFDGHWTTTPLRRWSMPSLCHAWTTAMQFLPGRRSPQLTLYSVCWMQQLVSSQTLTSKTVACPVYFTTSCTGLTSPRESSTNLLLWFAGVWRTKLLNISKTVADMAKVTTMTNRKSHMGFPLTPRSMTLDDLELL